MGVKIEQDRDRRFLMVLREGMGLWKWMWIHTLPRLQPSPAYMTDAARKSMLAARLGFFQRKEAVLCLESSMKLLRLSLVDEVSSVQNTIQMLRLTHKASSAHVFPPSSLIFCISDCRVVLQER